MTERAEQFPPLAPERAAIWSQFGKWDTRRSDRIDARHRGGFTVDIQLRFLAPVIDDDLVAEGWVSHRGRQIVFCDAEVRSGVGVLAATATLVYKVSSKPQTF